MIEATAVVGRAIVRSCCASSSVARVLRWRREVLHLSFACVHLHAPSMLTLNAEALPMACEVPGSALSLCPSSFHHPNSSLGYPGAPGPFPCKPLFAALPGVLLHTVPASSVQVLAPCPCDRDAVSNHLVINLFIALDPLTLSSFYSWILSYLMFNFLVAYYQSPRVGAQGYKNLFCFVLNE